MDITKLISICIGVCLLASITDATIQCKVCTGIKGTNCELYPEKELIELSCEKCIVFAQIYDNGNGLHSMQRDCAERIIPHTVPAEFTNTCKDDNSHFIECTHTCDTAFCNNDIQWNPAGWNEDGSKIGGPGGSAASLTSSMIILVTGAILSFF